MRPSIHGYKESGIANGPIPSRDDSLRYGTSCARGKIIFEQCCSVFPQDPRRCNYSGEHECHFPNLPGRCRGCPIWHIFHCASAARRCSVGGCKCQPPPPCAIGRKERRASTQCSGVCDHGSLHYSQHLWEFVAPLYALEELRADD